jgi:hypothetical protein
MKKNTTEENKIPDDRLPSLVYMVKEDSDEFKPSMKVLHQWS